MSRHFEGVVVLLIGVSLYCSPVILPVVGRLTLGRIGLALGVSAVGFVLLHVGLSLVADERMAGRAGRPPSCIKQVGREASVLHWFGVPGATRIARGEGGQSSSRGESGASHCGVAARAAWGPLDASSRRMAPRMCRWKAWQTAVSIRLQSQRGRWRAT